MSGLVQLEAITTFLDDYLNIAEIPDYPNAVNGLQVQNSGTVGYVVAAVDAAQATIEGAAAHAFAAAVENAARRRGAQALRHRQR